MERKRKLSECWWRPAKETQNPPDDDLKTIWPRISLVGVSQSIRKGSKFEKKAKNFCVVSSCCFFDSVFVPFRTVSRAQQLRPQVVSPSSLVQSGGVKIIEFVVNYSKLKLENIKTCSIECRVEGKKWKQASKNSICFKKPLGRFCAKKREKDGRPSWCWWVYKRIFSTYPRYMQVVCCINSSSISPLSETPIFVEVNWIFFVFFFSSGDFRQRCRRRASHQRRIQDLEEEHSIPLWLGDDPRLGMALIDSSVASRRDSTWRQGLHSSPIDSRHAHLRWAKPPAHCQRSIA